MQKTALLVIDIQKGTLAPLLNKQKFIENVNQMIHHFHEKNAPVIFIKQRGYGDISSKVKKKENDYIASKHKPNAFTSREFQSIIANLNIESYVVVGLMSNACVQHTCKGALAENHEVSLIEDAHDSIIKPMRKVWNKKLANLGVNVLSTKNYLNENK